MLTAQRAETTPSGRTYLAGMAVLTWLSHHAATGAPLVLECMRSYYTSLRETARW